MSRPLRIEYENAIYHVMNRGAARRIIFHTNHDREVFLKLLDEVSRKFRIEIHAYCLMSNHYHLLIRTPLANLQKAMRSLNGVYAQRFNIMNHSDGPVFRGRYKAIVVEKEDYLLRLSRYIHLNPVEARICCNPEDYLWSSYKYYLGAKQKPNWLITNETLRYFGDLEQQSKYHLFVNEGVDEETKSFYQKIKKIPIFGSEDFTKGLISKFFDTKKIHTEISECKMVKAISIPSIDDVIRVVANHYGVDIKVIKTTKRGKYNEPRAMAIFLTTEMCQQSLGKISKEFGAISYGRVSNLYRKLSKLYINDICFQNNVSKIKKLLQGET